MHLRFLFLPLSLTMVAAAATETPREKFLAAFTPFDGGPASVSPDGRHTAYARHEEDKAVVYVVNFDTLQLVFRAIVGKDERKHLVGKTSYTSPVRVTFLRWADSQRVVVATSHNHFIALNHEAKTGRHLVNMKGEERALEEAYGIVGGLSVIVGRRTGRVIALTSGKPAFALIEGVAPIGGGASHLVLRINVETGQGDVVHDEETAGQLIYDPAGRVRGRYMSGLTTDDVFLLKPELGKQEWQPLHQVHPTAAAPPPPLTPEAYFGERTFPLAIDRETLYFASNVGRNTFGIYALDLQTGERTRFALEDPALDLATAQVSRGHDNFVLDRVDQKVVGIHVPGIIASTRWFDPELAGVQETLDSRARGYRAHVMSWDDARERFVVEIYNRGDSGGYYLYTRSAQKLELLVRLRTPQPALTRVTSSAWSFSRPDGSTLSGWLVVPASPAPGLRPIVVRWATLPWQAATNRSSNEVLALAQMGFAVLEVNHRGIAGFGTAHFNAARHRFDAVAAEDIVTALKALPPDAGLDTGRVALMGDGYGGYLALRALQLHPGRFACAVTIEPVVDLNAWLRPKYPDSPYFKSQYAMREWFFGADQSRLRELSPASDPKSVGAPVMLVANPNSRQENWSEMTSFRRKLTSAGNPPHFVEVTGGITVPGAEKARLWGQIEDFLTKHLGR